MKSFDAEGQFTHVQQGISTGLLCVTAAWAAGENLFTGSEVCNTVNMHGRQSVKDLNLEHSVCQFVNCTTCAVASSCCCGSRYTILHIHLDKRMSFSMETMHTRFAFCKGFYNVDSDS